MPIFQRALCVHKLENIKDWTNKTWSQHSAPSTSSERDAMMINYDHICPNIGLFPISLSGHHLALVSLLLLPGRVLLAWIAPSACWAERRLGSTRGRGTVERNCKESQPALTKS